MEKKEREKKDLTGREKDWSKGEKGWNKEK